MVSGVVAAKNFWCYILVVARFVYYDLLRDYELFGVFWKLLVLKAHKFIKIFNQKRK